MSLFDDHPDEMQAQTFLDERTIDSILAGTSPSGRSDLDVLAGFATEVRSVATASAPQVGPALAAVLAGGPTANASDLPAMAGRKATGPARQPAERRTSRRSFLPRAVSVKAAAVLGGLTIATTGAAAADLLPQPAQNTVAAVVEAVSPIDLPDSDDTADKANDREHRKDDVADHLPSPTTDDNFGADVSDRARSAEDKGKDFGQSVSGDAPKADAATDAKQQRPAGTPASGDKPGNSHRETAPAQPPATTPTASDNPGTPHRESAPGRQPSGTPAGSRPGSAYRR
ncbi:MAG: hypothetical protein M3N28_09065 [Actinomycetota bacterium]|nr:hypothetical protein [Actinomycetota bacterium]